MKKWGFLVALVICLIFTFVNKETSLQDQVEIQTYKKINNAQLDNSEISENFQTKAITKEQVYKGNLVLINKKYPVHKESIKSDVVNLFTHKELKKGYELLDTKMELSEDVARKFSKMIVDARKEGVRHFTINSGFRDFDEQNALYQEMGSDYALPAGRSEHNLGLSLDVGSTKMKMNEALEGKWLENNAWKYGFIIRYPKDKTAITGIQYEPWHIRYVGLPHSVIMEEKNFTLEEYLDFLKKQKSISTNINGEKYEISYYPVTKNTTIHVPTNLRYEISGNNMDGVIVTVNSSTNTKEDSLAE
ncbi:VanY-A/VanY-F/VanY-M family D-Ala-D-Ala carboxypeptidase [Bacillus sp. AFS096315]|uniref:VanY-A/VanY-F/VanY-M family D-Ala-D-Ala carboxypeptidase n=1 Tax=Bacillus sp. AFS096315 TaxID=2033517 RepID=UPI000BEDB909|nr:VanY-A/VanY-F/VanY-M family D-Ala-D-Ala carboxypeptidase [Bacillus sp. AFS096315]PEC48210.1 D-Ala-D-Ala carboxypeptidase VanY [Bacillus sp. AFS096315]